MMEVLQPGRWGRTEGRTDRRREARRGGRGGKLHVAISFTITEKEQFAKASRPIMPVIDMQFPVSYCFNY